MSEVVLICPSCCNELDHLVCSRSVGKSTAMLLGTCPHCEQRISISDLQLGWESFMGIRNRTYRGEDPDDKKTKTLKVIDVTIEGDLLVKRRSRSQERWRQMRFLGFLANAQEV